MAFGYKYWMVYLPEFNRESFLLFVHNPAGSTNLRDYSRPEMRALGQPSWESVRTATAIGETRFASEPHPTTDVPYWQRKTEECNSFCLLAGGSNSNDPVARFPEPAKDHRKISASTGRAVRGSRRQIQDHVNEYPAKLSAAVIDALRPSLGQHQIEIRWVSPLAQDNYQEYRDIDFLAALGLSEFADGLSRFWPSGGPCWDALGLLGISGTGAPGFILIEAKSHIPEIYGSGCQAGDRSRQLIEHSLAATKRWYSIRQDSDWTGSLYQSANRLAHLYFFREVLKRPAWLINLYFLDDPIRPTSRSEWNVAIQEVKQALGLPGNLPNVVDVFLPALRSESRLAGHDNSVGRDLQRPPECNSTVSSQETSDRGSVPPTNHLDTATEGNQSFVDWANRWISLAQYEGAFVPDVNSRIECITSLWSEPIPGSWQRGIDPQLLGPRYRRGDVGAPHAGEHSIEHAILCTEFDRVRCFGSHLLDGVAALPLVRDAGGARRANVEADLLLLTGGDGSHQLFVCEVKSESNNAWYGAVENLRQLRLLLSSGNGRALFESRNPSLHLGSESPVTGLVLAPRGFYSAAGKKSNAVAPSRQLLAAICGEFGVDARLAVWNPTTLTIDRL